MQDAVSKRAFIVASLLERRGEVVSGEELSLRLGISRVALNKHIKKLIELGVPIVSVERKGYLLEGEPDLLIPEVVLAYLRNTGVIGKRYHFFPVVDSTNRVARDMAERGEPEGAVVAADYQTAGRGRKGRRWHSPAGRNLYFSVILRPSISAAFIYHVTMLASVAVCQALRELEVDALIKWPNDVYVSGKKICGVLTEADLLSSGVNYLVVGVGVNVNAGPEDFPEDVRGIATSLLMEKGIRFNRAKLLARILLLMDRWYAKLKLRETADLFRYWREHNYTIGRRVKVEGGLEGEAIGITPVGELLVRDEAGRIHQVSAGDVEVV